MRYSGMDCRQNMTMLNTMVPMSTQKASVPISESGSVSAMATVWRHLVMPQSSAEGTGDDVKSGLRKGCGAERATAGGCEVGAH
jgi:hypothetical protein